MFRRAHFYRAYSRLGLRSVPVYEGCDLNFGVEHGPDAVLTEGFLARFRESSLSSFEFPTPESLGGAPYYDTVAGVSGRFADLIDRSLAPHEVQVVVGGDHGVAFASMLSVLRRYRAEQVGLVLFDSHGDIHSVLTTPSGNFNAMWVRPLVDQFGHASVEAQVPERIPRRNLFYVGNLVLEPEEEEYLTRCQIVRIPRKRINADRLGISRDLIEMLAPLKHIHVSFDIDVFDRCLVSATGTPNAAGLDESAVFPLLRTLAGLPDISIDLVEVNPEKKRPGDTVRLAQMVLRTLLDKGGHASQNLSDRQP